MFGGDEVSAIVIDVGTATTKSGYGGEDTPKSVIPSYVGAVTVSTGNENTVGKGPKGLGEANDTEMQVESAPAPSKIKYSVGTNALHFRKDFVEIKNPLEKGLVTDWDVMEQLWEHSFTERLRIKPSEHPILHSEPAFNTRACREKLTELLFEKYEVPALFLSKNPVLTTFASGKSSGLVLDSGAGTTSVTPVHDGYALQKCSIKSTLAGNLLTEQYSQILEQKGVKITPHYLIQSKKEVRPAVFEVQLRDHPNTTQSYRDYMIRDVVRDIKEIVCRVPDNAFDEQVHANIPSITYELPDGNTIELGTDRFKIPELLFNPDPLVQQKREGLILPSTLENHEGDEWLSMPQMVYNSLAKCDSDIRRELLHSIIITGGSTLLPNFSERLYKELQERAPPNMYKIKLIATTTPIERKFSSWIGGSILGSLGTFQQMWMSKQEYEEFGRSIVERKCP